MITRDKGKSLPDINQISIICIERIVDMKIIEIVQEFFRNAHQKERGDVPGWVMITLMSAVLVAGLLAIAQPALSGLFDQAISQVTQ